MKEWQGTILQISIPCFSLTSGSLQNAPLDQMPTGDWRARGSILGHILQINVFQKVQLKLTELWYMASIHMIVRNAVLAWSKTLLLVSPKLKVRLT